MFVKILESGLFGIIRVAVFKINSDSVGVKIGQIISSPTQFEHRGNEDSTYVPEFRPIKLQPAQTAPPAEPRLLSKTDWRLRVVQRRLKVLRFER